MSDLEQPQVEDSTAQQDEPEVSATSADDEATPTDDAELETEQPAEPDEEETEYEGKTYKLPKELKDALLRQADYTRKTQEVAETRKGLEAQLQAINVERQVQQANLQEIASITAIDQQLAQFSQVNWQALADSDPVQAMKLDRQMRDMQAQRAQLANVVTQRQQQFFEWQQQQAASAVEEGLRVLQREIPGWNAELARELKQFAKSSGYPESFLDNVMHPRFVIDLHTAYQVAQAKKKATATTKPAQDKPVTRISATRATATQDPDRMSPEQWLKWRNSQLKRR